MAPKKSSSISKSSYVIRELGAQPIDRTLPAPPAEPGYDVIFDTVGGNFLDEAFASVRRYTGHVVSILGWGNHSLAPLSFRGANYSGVFTLLPLLTGEGRARHGEILSAAARLVDAGSLTPILHPQIYDWVTTAEAYHVVGSGAATGKVVINLQR